MEILIISLTIILINTAITALLLNCLIDAILERFKIEDEFDENVVENLKIIAEKLKLKYKISTMEADNKEMEDK